ncbi:MAG: autotransporter assembly complex protein TamA [Cellvibrionales bacterium]|nr:autotransporter assembly complex protein TamA [Cellvibrionales bacterium]
MSKVIFLWGFVCVFLIPIFCHLLFFTPQVFADNQFVIVGVNDSAVKENISVYLESLKKNKSVDDYQIQRLVKEATRAFGFYHTFTLVSQTKPQHFSVNVQLGPRMTIQSAKIEIKGEAATNKSFKKAIKKSSIRPNKPLDHGAYESLKSSLTGLALKEGYFDAKIEKSELLVDPKANVSDITLIFDSGKRYYFGETHFQGSQINVKKLYTVIPYKMGEPYLAKDIGLLNQRLANTGWYSSVYAGANTDKSENYQVPVNVLLVPAVKNKMETGIGYTTNHGPRLKLKWRKPWINSAGHSFNMQTEISQYEPTVQFAYKMPLKDILDDYYQFNGAVRYVDTHDTLATDMWAGAERHWRLGKWDQALFIKWLYEDYRQGSFESGVSNLGLVGLKYSHAYFSPGAVPKNAQKSFVSIGYTDTALGANDSLWQFKLRQGWIRTLAKKHRAVLKLDAEGNVTDKLTTVPPAMRYFIGGDNSIRGYRYQSVSPVDTTGKQVGGQYMATASAEYQYKLVGNWWGALFYDYGSSWVNTPVWVRGIGGGIRWASPVGSIRLDVGWGLDREGAPFEIHFSLGPEL